HAFDVDTPSQALEKIARQKPDLIICDVHFPGTEGVFEFIRELRSLELDIPVLVFSQFNERVIATRVLQAGAQGYLMKSASEKELESAIHRVLSGRVYLSGEMTERTIATLSEASPRTHRGDRVRDLTNRELEVLDLVGAGMASKEIAEALRISLKTVESHRSHIRAKLALDNSAELICFASQWRNLDGPRDWQKTVASA
ncbi:MAG: response regulator transcription factor, partial [Verrucomicrobiota bacterium]